MANIHEAAKGDLLMFTDDSKQQRQVGQTFRV